MSKFRFPAVFGAISAMIIGCASMPKDADAVSNIDKVKYLGKWYEIARYDFAFEKGLNNTTAEYGILGNGNISVTNRGYDYKNGKWKEAKGKARFKGSDTVGALEVSFFGPFYSAYTIIALDKDYRYALIAGSSTKYLWILSRGKTMPEDVKKEYLKKAESSGYDLSELIWVEHDK
jgi:apolipoprotein D and lipocalin family protein